MNLFELFVKLGVDDQASGKISNLTTKLKSGLATAAKVGTAAVVAVGAAATTAAKKIWDMSNQVAAAGDEIDKTSQKLGISAEAYQEWAYVFDRSGASIDGLKVGMKTLASVITDATNGASGAAEKLSAVGLAVEDLAGKTQEEQFEIVVSALQEMGAGAERTAAANDLLGRSSVEMAAILNMTAKETKALKDEAQEYGMVMSNDAVAASAHFQDMLTLLQGSVNGLKNSLVSDLLPALSDVIEGFADIFGGKGKTGKIESGISSLAEVINKSIPEATEALLGIASAVVKTVPTIITTLVTSLTNEENFKKITKAGADLLDTLGDSLMVVVPALIDGAGTVITNLITWLLDPVQIAKLLKAGGDLIGNIMDGLAQAYDKIGEAVSNAVSAFIAFFKAPENLQDIKKGGEKLVDDLMGFLTDKESIASIGATAGKILGFLVDGIATAVGVLFTAAGSIFSALSKYLVGGEGTSGEPWDDTANDIMESLGEGFVAFWGEFQPVLKQLEDKMTSWFTNIDWAKVGREILGKIFSGDMFYSGLSPSEAVENTADWWKDLWRDKTKKEENWLEDSMSKVSSEGLQSEDYRREMYGEQQSSGRGMTVNINAVAQTPQEIIADLRFAEVAGGIQ